MATRRVTGGALVRRSMSAIAAIGVLIGASAACRPSADDGSGDRSASPATSRGAGATGSPTASSPAAGGLTKEQVKQALPDPHAMGAWEPVTAYVTTANGRLGCPSPEQCPGKWFGHVKYKLTTGLAANFDLITYLSVQDAQNGLKQDLARTARYPALPGPKVGEESHAYQRTAGGLSGAYVTMRIGTVVATAVVEGGATEPALTQTSKMFAERIRQVEAGRKADATLPQY